MADPTKNAGLRIPCVMAGEQQVLTVHPIGQHGVTFGYGDDASVIVNGADLVAIRDLLIVVIARTKA